ncbi:MAG: relaxase domain-containing protein [Planctomycetales bacterium]|nr:relaxase domain-containing protein [Planctomycetales bacterium]
MLSIARVKDISYYHNLPTEDYYREAEAAPTRWLGSGAHVLGLAGEVDSHAFLSIFSGYSTDGRPLTQNAGKEKRCPGWDLTFSAPKSVSVLWGIADHELRTELEACFSHAVSATFALLERDAAWTRKGKGGIIAEPTRIVAATFRHGTSRALDPNLHMHCLVANVSVGHDGMTRALDSRQLYKWKMALGVAFRVPFAEQLEERLGLRIVRDRDSFRLRDVPTSICHGFSKRSQTIRESMRLQGRTSARAAEFAALDTRQQKSEPSHDLLHETWQTAATKLGFGPNHAIQVLERSKRAPITQSAVETQIASAIDRLTSTRSHFTKRVLIRELGTTLMGQSVSYATMLAEVDRQLQHCRDIVHLPEVGCERYYTTVNVLAHEADLLANCDRLHRTQTFGVSQLTIDRVLAKFPGIQRRPEQVAAVNHVLEPGALKTLSGMPGTGKTFVLNAAREAWQNAGYTVIGAALAGRAARELQSQAGIRSETIAKTLRDVGAAPLQPWKHHARQLLRTARGRPTYRYDPVRFNDKTVLVIDEMGMVGTAESHRLVAHAVKCGAKVVMVGDPQQLSPINSTGVFRHLLSRYPTVRLTHIERQQDPKDVEAIHDLSRGDHARALAQYRDRGLVTIAEDRRSAQLKLVSDWCTHGGLYNPADHLILVNTNTDGLEINRRCQEAREAAGLIHPERFATIRRKHRLEDGTTRIVREDIHVGDRVMFLERSRALAVENGNLGLVVGYQAESKILSVRLDVSDRSSQTVHVPVTKYQALTLGYAGTTHKFQGATVPHAYVLVGGSMQSREMTYTQLSRAKYSTRLYADQLDTGPDLSRLVAQLDRSESQPLAHELLAQRPIEKQRSQPSLSPPTQNLDHSRGLDFQL